MTTIKRSKILGSTADYFGDITVFGNSQPESKLNDYCPFTKVLDSESMVHMSMYADRPSHLYTGFDSNYSIKTLTSGSNANAYNIVSDKNFIITPEQVLDLRTGIAYDNEIEDITSIGCLMDSGRLLCCKKVSTTLYWKIADPFTGQEYDNLTNLDTTGLISFRYYFRNNTKEYVGSSNASNSNMEELYNLTDDSKRTVWYFGSGTTGYWDLYYNDTAPKSLVKQNWFSGGTPAWRITFYNVFNSYSQDVVYTSSPAEQSYPVAIDQNNSCLYIRYPTSQTITRYNIDTWVKTNNWITGISLIDQDPNIVFDNKLLVLEGSNLWNFTSGSLMCSTFPSLDSVLYIGDNKNQWIWGRDGTDLVAIDFDGDEQYRIEDVMPDTPTNVLIDFQKNKFILTWIRGFDPLYNALYGHTIIHWDYEETE
jgi:hypothetical protein